MGKSVFSVPIFFIVFRETLEAVIIVSVLLGLVEQIVLDHDKKFRAPAIDSPSPNPAEKSDSPSAHVAGPSTGSGEVVGEEDDAESAFNKRRLIRKMRIQIFAGAGVGLFVALAVGAAFIAVWFTQAADLWSKSEELWEGIFSLVASLIILVMGVTMLKLDRAKAKWRVKLMHAFNKADRTSPPSSSSFFLLLQSNTPDRRRRPYIRLEQMGSVHPSFHHRHARRPRSSRIRRRRRAGPECHCDPARGYCGPYMRVDRGVLYLRLRIASQYVPPLSTRVI